MPVILKIEHQDGQCTALWEITENEQTLLEMASLDDAGLHTFSLLTNEGRRMEWLAVRALLKELHSSASVIGYLENGKPFLLNHSDYISISHSGKMVGIVTHPNKNPGLDIEALRPKIHKIAYRFLGEREIKCLGASPTTEQLTIIWAAKEVLYKVYGQTCISFQRDFEINPFELSPKGKLEGSIHRDDNLTIPMEYRKIGEFILVQTDYTNTLPGH